MNADPNNADGAVANTTHLPSLLGLKPSDLTMPRRKKRKRSDGARNVGGAAAVWKRLRHIETSNATVAVPAQSEERMAIEIERAAELILSSEKKEEQLKHITEHYRNFVASIKPKTDEWRAVHKYVVDGEGYFNSYLSWTDEDKRYENDITRHYEELMEDSDSDGSDAFDGDDDGDWSAWHRPERQVFALFGLFRRAPRLQKPITVLHSVVSRFHLPHGPKRDDGGNTRATRDNWKPTKGKAYFNTKFLSTSLASLNDYLSVADKEGPLAKFYRRHEQCCMCAITVDAKVPIVPVFMENRDDGVEESDDDDDWHGKYGKEQEVLLPPGLLYVFQGNKEVTVVDEKASQRLGKQVTHTFEIFFYRAVLPNDALFDEQC